MYNDELYRACGEFNIVKRIKSVRLTWAGHIARTTESCPAKQSTFDQLLDERKAERPKKRRIEEVEKDLKGMEEECGGGQGVTRL
jgi:hypothetical protein